LIRLTGYRNRRPNRHLPPASSHDISPETLKRIEATLIAQSSPSVSTPVKCLSDKLTDHVALGNRLVNQNKLTKASSLQWIVRLKVILQPLFGNGAPYLMRLEETKKTSATKGLTTEEFSDLLGAAGAFAEILKITAGSVSGSGVSHASGPPATKNVFIIHGHDELNARRLSDLLRENNLVPIVMRAQPGMSRVLTDKFEAEASKCSFAFAIFTPDDAVRVGSQQYGQARPNVIYETGWFIGRLGKERVVLLLKHGTEMHTDLQGVSRVQFVEDVSHAYGDIQRELRAAALIG
jgi:predicted nucleotide-binding protein